MKNRHVRFLGIDIGSVSTAVAALNDEGELLAWDYRFHRGKIEKTLSEAFATLEIESADIVLRTSDSPDILEGAPAVDEKIAYIKAANRSFEKFGSILIVGAETFSIIHFGEDGSYQRMRTNSSCAAGTGSFLDQQAGRLSLRDSAALSEMALANEGEVPKIASRCAVFAKTDLIHAQAEGYSLGEICDGLCLGLAKNISDSLVSDEAPPKPILFAGGVSKNGAVLRHLERLLDSPISTDEKAPIYGAWGAALACLDGTTKKRGGGSASAGTKSSTPYILSEMIRKDGKEREYYYSPLSLELSSYPDFAGRESFVFSTKGQSKISVETDIYEELPAASEIPAYLGIDIGSTSSKAVLTQADGGKVYAGFYTRTAGKPLYAVQGIFETIRHVEEQYSVQFDIRAAATTGSGRTFIGRVIGADLIIDEITAHAKAAYKLDPRIDTIIEIGGQDSKFTTLRDGLVTFSQMNTICAAGTGSFIEEQAAKRGVPLSDYSARAEGNPAPLTSDRCTVFMERDINNYLNKNYSVDEVLAAALFSVRENYLQKVATEAHIGRHVCFQGATAKNRALVAAFEEKLGRPLFVSKYCHLTGALGAALLVEEETAREASGAGTDTSATTGAAIEAAAETIAECLRPRSFRGIDLYKREIPVRTEICELCTNHCRIRIAEIAGENVAFGFLCGRDYDTRRYVDRNLSGFDLIKSRRKLFADASRAGRLTYADGDKRQKLPTIGLPAGLHMVEDLSLWRHFFAQLGFPVITSEKMDAPIKRGKKLAGAEFCAPMTALHGHVDFIAEKADLLFLPFSLEARKEKHEEQFQRKYCYYTQYGPSLMKEMVHRRQDIPALTPLIRPGHFRHNIAELNRLLSPYRGKLTGIIDIARAYSSANQYAEGKREQLREIFDREFHEPLKEEIQVVLVGRPYTVLSPTMNNRIPEIFASLGVKAYFQDMIPSDPELREEIEPILSAFHWHYAADILEAAAYAAGCDGLYPVYISSFKCSPDSFAVDYFKRILDAKNKPYLILQLDEHDSSVGYETRIEAGVRAFKNHARSVKKLHDQDARFEEEREGFKIFGLSLQKPKLPDIGELTASVMKKRGPNPVLEKSLAGKTLLFPNWDPLTSPLITANLRREGIDARLLEEDPLSIQKSMRLNTGQCLPVNIVAQEAMDYVRKHRLDPSQTVLWIARGRIACNIPLYPYYLKNVFEAEEGGMEELGVYLGDISHMEIGPKLAGYAYFAYMFGGLLRKLGCRIRPYEVHRGETDAAVSLSRKELEEAFLGRRSFDQTLEGIIRRFEAIEQTGEEKPKIAVFGDLYVRDNDTMNQDLIHRIEDAGGEVITTPYNEYAKIISRAYFHKWFKNGMYLTWIKNRSLLAAMGLLEKKYYSYFREFFESSEAVKGEELEERLAAFNLTLNHDGESMENILKIFHVLQEHEDVALFVQASPSYCCPALVTEAMNRDIERLTGVPVVSITYDGTGTPQNDQIVPYLTFRRAGVKAR